MQNKNTPLSVRDIYLQGMSIWSTFRRSTGFSQTSTTEQKIDAVEHPRQPVNRFQYGTFDSITPVVDTEYRHRMQTSDLQAIKTWQPK
jgi:hypothetical protein